MDEPFELPVEYMGQHFLFKASLLVYGYSHKFSVEVNGEEILFEPDEERNYRAVLTYTDIEKHINFDVALLKAIATTIEQWVK